jgi:hypothetical protein
VCAVPSAAEGRAWSSASSRAEEARRTARRHPLLRVVIAVATRARDREGRTVPMGDVAVAVCSRETCK